jgi:hypothetical protein
MSFLRELLNSKPVRTPLSFGINERVRLVSLSNEEKKKDGEVIKRNTYMVFSKFDEEEKIIASSEFSYFNLDPTKDFTMENLASQTSQLQNLCDLLSPGSIIDPLEGYDSLEEVEEDLGNIKGCKKLQGRLYEQFEKAVGDKIGKDSPLIRLKVVTDNKGKFLQLPRESRIAELNSDPCTLSISAYELKVYESRNESSTTEKPDEAGESPDSAKKSIMSRL